MKKDKEAAKREKAVIRIANIVDKREQERQRVEKWKRDKPGWMESDWGFGLLILFVIAFCAVISTYIAWRW